MMDELVSVIIPTYNRRNTIGSAIKSVLEQSYQKLEVIIVDDCSTDDTDEIISKIDDPRVRYLKLEVNSGPSVARNAGIKAAGGAYIAFQDSDDLWEKDKLQVQLELMGKDPSLGLVYTGIDLISEKQTLQFIPPKAMDIRLKEGFIYESLLKENKIGTPTMLIKKEVLNTLGGFDESLRACEDWELSVRIAKHYKIGFINSGMVKAHSNEHGVNSNAKNVIAALCHVLLKYEEDFRNYSLINEKISEILENCINLDNLQTISVRKRLIPKIIGSEADFEALYHQAKRTCKFKNYYDTLIKIVETKGISQRLQTICTKNNWNSVAIYGMGRIGRLLHDILVSSQVEVSCGIDKYLNSDTEGMIKIIKPADINNNIDVIIVTAAFDYLNTIKELREYTNCDIVSVRQLL